MRIAQNFQKNVFCLEGEWEKDLRDKSTVAAALEFLQANCGIQYIHKNCGTVENMKYYLSQWKQAKYKHYSICYLAFHGQPEQIEVGDGSLNLEQLAQILNGSCRNKIIHFGSCNTLNTDAKSIQQFLDTTKALCVCGFKTDIDFVESSVFDMLLLQKFQEYKDMSAVKRDLDKNYRKLIRKLDFRIHYN
jgi:hypothetical protein